MLLHYDKYKSLVDIDDNHNTNWCGRDWYDDSWYDEDWYDDDENCLELTDIYGDLDMISSKSYSQYLNQNINK